VALVKKLGLRPDVRRTVVGFMGCHAAFNGLRIAHGFCQSDPDACVLLACVELCTLHFNVDESVEATVINALFSDGAAAAILRSRSDDEPAHRLTFLDEESLLDDDSEEYMTWEIGDQGFAMGLSARVPALIAGRLDGFLKSLLGRHGLAPSDIRSWAIHPGGKRIVEKIGEQLGLSGQDVFDSLEVLRLHGNMSSPTILFVLKRLLDRVASGEVPAGSHGVAMAFGPGLTLEGCLLRVT
jgi:predicted naringenin-chalcone synthase